MRDTGHLPEAVRSLDALLSPGSMVTTPDGQVRAARLSLDDRVVLEEHDLVDPTGRVRVERLGAGPVDWGGDAVRGVPLFGDLGGDDLLGWLVAVSTAAAASEGTDVA
ncbi:MAG: hypothetical protein QM572_07105, partial [Nocardioides sp.]|uniref:hypothetical protein n=1 Tax=Nocardioides sp. TaxID=35761 RepID=UPI0039E28727